MFYICILNRRVKWFLYVAPVASVSKWIENFVLWFVFTAQFSNHWSRAVLWNPAVVNTTQPDLWIQQRDGARVCHLYMTPSGVDVQTMN